MSSMILIACVFVPLIIGVPLTTVIRKRLGVVGAQQLLLLIAGVALVLIAVVPDSLILACLAVAGFGLAGPQTLTNVLFAQVADEDELRSGVRREGAFFGVNALLTKPAQSVALALIPAVLESAEFVHLSDYANPGYLNSPQIGESPQSLHLKAEGRYSPRSFLHCLGYLPDAIWGNITQEL